MSLSPNPLHVADPKTEEPRPTIPPAQFTLDVLVAHLSAHPVGGIELEDRRDPLRVVQRVGELDVYGRLWPPSSDDLTRAAREVALLDPADPWADRGVRHGR